MTQLILLRAHQTEIELCYTKQRGAWLLYDDTEQPRQLIATISGCDLNGWRWNSETPKLSMYWHSDGTLARWRAALVEAAMSYINH